MVSHDLRTPLSIIKMSLELMQRTGSTHPKTVGKLLERGLRAADAIDRLSQGVLELVKVENGSAMPALLMVSPAMLVHDAIELTLPLAEQKSVQLQADTAGSDAQVCCERSRIEQVLGNLISNALKFTPEGGCVTVSTRNEGDLVAFSVEDTGVGIAERHIRRVFERFWQESSFDSQGNGLGLAIARGIVEQHGSTIRVRSMDAAYGLEGVQILYVEDEDDLREMTAEMPAMLGCPIRSVPCADDAIRETLQEYDLLLSDVWMPGSMDCIEQAKCVFHY